ncbi:MAG: hypothetical protein AB9882_02675 [Ignavibacteriaceae bacterium]
MIFLLVQSKSVSQVETKEEPETRRNRITVELLGGWTVYSKVIYKNEADIPGFTGGLRLMWEPDKLLRIGLHTGYLQLARSKEEYIQTEFGETKRSSALNVYPLTVTFNMKVYYFELILGLGAGFVTSKINAFNETSESSVITSAKLYGIGYLHNFNKDISLGGELKYYSFSTPEVTNLTIEIKGKYAFLEW